MSESTAREQLKSYTDEQALLVEVTQRIARGGPLSAILPDIAQMAWRGVSAGGVRIVLNDSTRAYAAGPLVEQMAPHDAYIMKLAEGGQPVELNDLNGHNLNSKLTAVIVLPLMAQFTMYGVIWAGYDQPHTFNNWTRAFLNIVAGQTAVATANAYAFDAARQGREQLAAILSSSADPILVVDASGRVMLINPAGERALGVSGAQIAGKPASEVLDAAPLVELLNGTEGSESIEWQNKTGQAFSPRVSDINNEHGERTGRVLMLRDITRYKTLRDNQSEFVSTVSHDLRSPLTYMHGYATMLPMVGALNEKQQGFADKIVSGIVQMTDLVDKILDASRLDPEGNYQLNREPCDIRKVVTDIVGTHAPAAEKKTLTLTSEIDPGLPILRLDDMMIRRALNNLVDNAIKYTPTGGTITIQAKVDHDVLLLSVQDTGLGISPEHQKQIFERFRRVRRREHQTVKGSGLGLYIVKRIAQRHGGDATLASQEGKGSTFTIKLPLETVNLLGGDGKKN